MRDAAAVVQLEEQHERLPQLARVRGAGAPGGLRGGVLDDLGLGLVAHGGEALHEAGGADAGNELGRVPPAPGRLRLRLRLLVPFLLLRRRLSLRRLLVFLHRCGSDGTRKLAIAGRRSSQQPAAEGIESGGDKRVRHGQEKKP